MIHEEVKEPNYTEEEREKRSDYIEKMERAKRMRGMAHDEFDGMTYEQAYETDSKAAFSYIPPKKNPEDTRIVTGVTEEKEKTLLATLLDFEFRPNIKAYDKDNFEIVELGENAEAMITKAKKLEEYEIKAPLILREFLDHGTVFIENSMVEWTEVEKKIKGNDKFAKAIQGEKNWEEKTSEVFREIRTTLIPGLNVYLGNIREFFMNRQPYVFIREYMTYEMAETIYGEWARWENVPPNFKEFSERQETQYNKWSLLEVEKGFVEVLKYQDKFTNEYQIFINGVMMLPVGFPLSALTGRNVYTIIKGDINPISPNFAYSRSIPAMTKVDQRILDEVYKLIILKMQKSFAPSWANNTGRAISSKVFLPGTIVDDISADDLKPIGDATGVSNADFQMFEFIKRQIDEKSISPVFQGSDLPGRQTATEILELTKQAQKKLGLAIWGVTQLERQLSWLILNNIINFWTESESTKIDKLRGAVQKFKTIEVNDTFQDGTNGSRMIEFSTDNFTERQIMAQEKLLTRKKGVPVRKFIINPKLFKSMKIHWDLTIEPTERETDNLERAQFTQMTIEGYQIFGPQSFNQDYLKTQYAIKNKMDKSKLFVPMEPQMMGPESMLGPGGSVNDRLRQSVGGRGSGVSANPAAKVPLS